MVSPNGPVKKGKGAAAASSSSTRGNWDRRRSVRIESLTAGKLTPPGKEKPVTGVQVFDVSQHGVGFRVSRKLATGDVFDVEIGNGPLFLSGTVRITSVRARNDGSFETGADFI